MENRVICVDPKQVHLVWYEVSHWIKIAFERTDAGLFETVERKVLDGRALLWFWWNEPKIECAAVTELTRTENSKICEIIAVGGSGRRRWPHLIQTIENYARSERCGAVQMLGRRGWARVFKNYKITNVLLERRL